MIMREILFRGKRADNGEWAKGNLFVPDKSDTPMQICVGTNIIRISYDVIPETVGQYTGLNDCNGKKIFEGDIVSFRHPFQNRHGIYLVSFIGSGFNCENFYQSHFDNPNDAFSEGTEYFEVIGNVYDNPDMLESGDPHDM